MKLGFTKKDFRDMLEPNGECLEWTGRHGQTKGYGRTRAYGKIWKTHRLSLHLEGVDVSGHHVLHSCDNPRCCNPEHLRLGTNADNIADKVSRGRQPRKLTEQQVLEIRAIRGMTRQAIAKRYGVCRQNINRIIHRSTWKHI